MTSIGKIANQIIRQYDRNSDGAINIKDGKNFEAERYATFSYQRGDYEEFITYRYTDDKLFLKADTNGDKQITKDELMAVIKMFDTNNDGKLKNKGPFWNRKGEKRNFEKAYPGQSEIVDRRVIYRPRPPHVPIPRALEGRTVGIAIA